MKKKFPFLLSIIWLILIFFINPIGEFPLNDDWSYTHNVKALALDHQITFDDWGAMTLIAHTIWGTLFCKIFGFSFTALRVSTLIISWIGLLATFFFFREGGLEKKKAFWATLLIALNPLYLVLSFSYMTDIPFMCFVILSALFFLKFIHKKPNYNLYWATVFSVIATLIRQPGILLPLSFFFIYILKNKTSLKSVFQSVIPLFSTTTILILFTTWRKNNYGLSNSFGTTDHLIENIFNGKITQNLSEQAHGIFIYWGIFLLPFLFISFSYFWKKEDWKTRLLVFVITLLCIFPFLEKWNYPLHGNIIFNLGIGPHILAEYPESYSPYFSVSEWNNLKLIGFIGGVNILLWLWFRFIQTLFFLIKRETEKVNWATAFSLTTAGIYFFFLMTNDYFFDRYYLMPLPFLVLIIFPKNHTANIFILKKWTTIPAAAIFSMIAFFSITATKDNLSWNRTRWKATEFAINKLNIPIKNINGGFEFNGWNRRGVPLPTNWGNQNWWQNKEGQFTLSSGPLCGYETIKTFPNSKILPPQKDTIFILKKSKIASSEIIRCDAETLTFDSTNFQSNLENYVFGNIETRSSEQKHTGNYSILTNEKTPFGFTIKLGNVSPCERIWFQVWRFPTKSTAAIVGAASNPKDFYQLGKNKILQTKENGWSQITTEFVVPKNFRDSNLVFYIFNPTKNNTWFDDLEITRLKIEN
ncbi:MAG: ArnT family glycosyltransferase [Saprospiraceae bacterium]